MTLRWFLGRRSRSRGGATLSTLIFHRVLRQPDALFPEIPDAARFERQMRWIAGAFEVLPLDRAVARLRDGSLPPRALAITFDDGYADNREVAAPILRRLGLPATFFVTSGMLDGGRMWNDTVIEAIRRTRQKQLDLEDIGLGTHPLSDVLARRRAIDAIIPRIKRETPERRQRAVDAIAHRAAVTIADDLMMSSAQVAELRGLGVSVGAHTTTHPILTRLAAAEAEQEIRRGRDALEAITGERVALFAYPNGVPYEDFDATHVQIVRRLGFDAAFTTSPGVAAPDVDPMQLPRFTPWQASRWRFLGALASNMARSPVQVV